MIESIPDVCDSCGSDEINTTVHRKHASSSERTINAHCENCGNMVVHRERIKTNSSMNYKSPVQPDDE